MRSFSLIVCLSLAIGVFLSAPLYAESSWFDKGSDLLRSLGGGSKSSTAKEPTLGEIGGAFKDALRIGSEAVVNQLGKTDGFNADPAVHIPLPKELQTVKKLLKRVGMSNLVNDVELKMNRAAEAATPKAKKLFFDAIASMTFDDVKKIYNGPDDSATQYFRNRMSPELAKEMRPIVDKTLQEVGAVKAYDNMMGQYKSMPFVPDIKANLTNQVVEKGMDGIFHYLAIQEAEIRKNPVRQTTDLLKKVFGKS